MKKKSLPLLIFLIITTCCSLSAQENVKCSEQELVLPTYQIGEPEINPAFYVPKDCQGTQAIIYPYPMLDKLTDKKSDVTYNAIVLENEYIKICVLPELGGRLFYAVDKTNNYDFVYYNHVIKPALIGSNGAWISGGGEWNANHHHRITAYMPCDYRIIENSDGSKTIWVGEYEKRHSTRWEVGLTLYPGKNYIEKKLKMLNVTPVAQSFLYFANIAVHSNENYQVIFPPDVEQVVFHHKIEFTTWPFVTSPYRGIMEYKKGYDVSWWKNTFGPTSFFAWGSEMDFSAGYDHGKQAGTILIGDHHIMTGKKFWNWGNNDIAFLWDKILTDSDGPYLELMMGAYSDNQPDYSWYHPYTTKEATMYYYPSRCLNSIKNANKDFAINLEVKDGKLSSQVNSTAAHENILFRITGKDKTIIEKEIKINPALPFSYETVLPDSLTALDLKLTINSKEGKELISYQAKPRKNEPLPEVYTNPDEPQNIKSTEDLYMTGLRLEQFFNPIFDPKAYYYEALRREPNHILVNTQLGLNYLKQMVFDSADFYLGRAVKQVTRKYTTAKYSEPLYYLGLSKYEQGQFKEAYDLLAKAAWSYEWTSAASYLLAVMDCLNKDYEKALENVNKAVFYNNSNTEALVLKSVILRNLGKTEEALLTATNLNSYDPLNFGAIYEMMLANEKINKNGGLQTKLKTLMRDDPDNYLETLARYGNAGFYKDAVRLLETAVNSGKPGLVSYPMIYYYLGYYYNQMNDNEKASAAYKKAGSLPIDYCFPYGIGSANILKSVTAELPGDANANYYLGNILADHNPQMALKCLLRAIEINNTISVFHRNAAFIYANTFDDLDNAIKHIEKAIALNPNDPLYFVEADNYYRYAGFSPDKAMSLYEKNLITISKSDEAMEHYMLLCNLFGKYDKAIETMNTRHFHSYEAFEGGMHVKWTDAHLMKANKYLNSKKYNKALQYFKKILEFPLNLDLVRDSKTWAAYYYIGLCYKQSGDKEKAEQNFNLCIEARNNDGWSGIAGPLTLYCKALSYKELNKLPQADSALKALIETGQSEINFKTHFAEDMHSVKKRYENRKRISNGYLCLAFGNLGLNNREKADEYFAKALETDKYSFDAMAFSQKFRFWKK